jgi:hypothetical protein
MTVRLLLTALLAGAGPAGWAPAGELNVDLGDSKEVTFVGALARWNEDGKARAAVDPKARIDRPDAIRARRADGNRWVFHNLPPGRYDLVLLAGRVRVEGFHYPPVLDFDPFLAPTADAPEEAREKIAKHIAQSQHYENEVAPLYMAGDAKQVRVLVQLVRAQETSYDAEYGTPVATIRHEVWQYTFRYGGWVKEKSTRVLDRILLPRAELRRWTWVWEPRLGGVEVADKAVTVTYRLPARFDPTMARGWCGE